MKSDTTVYLGIDEQPLRILGDGVQLQPDERARSWCDYPNVFRWGYVGAGPGETAFVILLDFLQGDRPRAEAIHRDFTEAVIAHLPKGGNWILEGWEIRAAIERLEEFRRQRTASSKGEK